MRWLSTWATNTTASEILGPQNGRECEAWRNWDSHGVDQAERPKETTLAKAFS
jgi:hypothetical protein